MGKVTVYCLLSGCSPEIHRSLWAYHLLKDEDEDDKAGPIVQSALKSLLDAREIRSQDDVTLIGLIGDDGLMTEEEYMDEDEISGTPDLPLVAMRCTVDGEYWDFGSIPPPGPNPEYQYYTVSYGPCIMVQTAALSILLHATDGRMHAHRLWRLVMMTRRLGGGVYDGIPGISYWDDEQEWDVWQQDPEGTPGMSLEDVKELEVLGDVKEVRKAIVDRGLFWVWMSPDRFPLAVDSTTSAPIHIVSPPSACPHTFAPIELLPHELIIFLAAHFPLPTILNLASASRFLRFRILGAESDRDILARAWIAGSAPWYKPLPLHPFLKRDWMKCQNDATEHEMEEEGEGANIGLGWEYLCRCLASGSMRNRRRIWGIAEQLERRAEGLGL